VSAGNREVACFLLNAGADYRIIAYDGWNPVVHSLASGHRAIFEAFVGKDREYCVNFRTNVIILPELLMEQFGESLFHLAARYGRHELLKQLVSFGMRVNEITSVKYVLVFSWR
jgi:ankyrin repeat protein